MSLEEHSPWMCHVCDRKSTVGEAEACSVCYKTTCVRHLKWVPVETDAGLVVLKPVCVYCQMKEMV